MYISARYRKKKTKGKTKGEKIFHKRNYVMYECPIRGNVSEGCHDVRVCFIRNRLFYGRSGSRDKTTVWNGENIVSFLIQSFSLTERIASFRSGNTGLSVRLCVCMCVCVCA